MRAPSRLTTWLAALGAFGAVALVAQAARIFVPAYRHYAIRAQVAEGLELAEPFQRLVRTEWLSRRAFADLHSDATYPPLVRRSTYVDDVAIASGAVVITFGSAAQSDLAARTLTLVPALDVTGDRMEWQCGRGVAPEGYEAIFVEPARLTDVPDGYLPEGCRQP
jgi:type IV pilus assembly protein PilA